MLSLSVTVPAAGAADPRYMVVVRDHDSPEQPLVLEYRLAPDGTPSLVGHIASCLRAAEWTLRLEVPPLANRGAADAPAPGDAPARRRLGVYAPEFLRDVAAEYVELVAAGVRSPVTGLARRRGVHFSTAAGWLSHARAAGYLGPQPRTPRQGRPPERRHQRLLRSTV